MSRPEIETLVAASVLAVAYVAWLILKIVVNPRDDDGPDLES